MSLGGAIGGLLGGVLGGKGGGGNTSTTTVQQADPWSGVQPALNEMYAAALANFRNGGPAYYPGSTVAPQSTATQRAQQSIFDLATRPDQALQGAQGANAAIASGGYLNSTPGSDTLRNIASGSMLNSNPYLDATFDKALRRVQPSIQSMFEGAGRYGSNASQEAMGHAATDLATSIYGGNYANERTLQQQALQELGTQYGKERLLQQQAIGAQPNLSEASYMPFSKLATLGATQDLYGQSLVDADVSRWNAKENQRGYALDFLNRILSGAPGGSTTGTVNGSNSQPGNPVLGALGGYALGNSIFNGMGGGGPQFANLGTITGDDASIFW